MQTPNRPTQAQAVPEAAVRRVMADLGLDYRQAVAHVRQSMWLQDRARRRQPVKM